MTQTGAESQAPIYDIERGAQSCRAMREVTVGNGEPLYVAIDSIAKDLVRHMRRHVDEANAIEWGRALIVAAASVGILATDDMSKTIVNVLAFAGVDLLDGKSAEPSPSVRSVGVQ